MYENIKKNRFEFIMDKNLYMELCSLSKKLAIKKNSILRNALKFTLNRYANGFQDFKESSSFLYRRKKSNKKRFQVILYENEKESLLKLAFTLRISMGETLRIILENYICLSGIYSTKEIENTSLKCRNTVRKINPMLVIYEIVRSIEERHYIYSKPPPYKIKYR